MNVFDVLTMLGGLCLFLFGMNIMGDALERRAGNSLQGLLGRLTTGRLAGLLTGIVVTGVIQSSSATTVMVVGFVNSGLMSLRQALHVIMGANVGTTVTAWVLSLAGIESSNVIVQLLKPMSFTPVLALVGIVFTMTGKDARRKDTGNIFLGFAVLMFGMDIMSGAVSGLRDVPAFRQLFVAFQNPVLGVLAGAVLTGIIQSSSASVGILQSLAFTGQVSYAAAIPIIMGQNIGTCVTAMLSSVGANRNARRAALVHLMFNIIGTVVLLAVYLIARSVANPVILTVSATPVGIAVCHSVFNVACTVLLLPMAGLLERLVCRLVPDARKPVETNALDERLLTVPSVALERSRAVTEEMAQAAGQALEDALRCLRAYDPETAARVRENEDRTDRYEDMLNAYLVKVSSLQLGVDDTAEAAVLLKVIGDYERIADHAANLVESAEELKNKDLCFSEQGTAELSVLCGAVGEVFRQAHLAFCSGDAAAAHGVQALEEVIDDRKEALRSRHIARLQSGRCSIDLGFVWSDLLTDLERISDHCSNVAACVLELAQKTQNSHSVLLQDRPGNPDFDRLYAAYSQTYALPAEA